MWRIARTRRSSLRANEAALEFDCFVSLGAEVERHVAQGKRKLLVTSSGPGEGKSTIAAGLARAVAGLQGTRVVLVDTDQFRPYLHRLFTVGNTRGLGELLNGVYRTDPRSLDAKLLSLGDWIELLQVQGRNGRLLVTDDKHGFVVSLLKGAIVSIVEQRTSEDQSLGDALVSRGLLTSTQREDALRASGEIREPLAEVVLRQRLVEPDSLRALLRDLIGERVQQLSAIRRPKCEFSAREGNSPAPPDQRRAPSLEGWGIDDYAGERLRELTKRPYLQQQIERCLRDTELANLKLLTSGALKSDLLTSSGAMPLRRLLDDLSRMFDVVIVDSPPIAVTSPAEVIAEMVDGVLMVVKAGGYEVQIVRRAKERLVNRGAPLLGLVLNQVQLQRADETLHYYYSYTKPSVAGRTATAGHRPARTKTD